MFDGTGWIVKKRMTAAGVTGSPGHGRRCD